MGRLYYLVQKEFIQILRNKAMLPLITIVPIMQLVLLSFAADNEVKNVNLAIVNQSYGEYAQRIISKVQASDRFIIVDFPKSVRLADRLLQEGVADIVLNIPMDFEDRFLKYKNTDIQLLVNAINGQQASVGTSYLSAIIQGFNRELRVENMPNSGQALAMPRINIENSYWYNEKLNYQHFMVPGIIAQIITILIILLTSMNVVREVEIGTIEQINVTPIKKWEFILGKLLPFLIIGMILLTVGLVAGKAIFDIPLRGNLMIVIAYSALNITAILGLGLFISNMSDTQQQAMFTTFFFVIIFILMSGLFTPIESMPKWAQYLTIPNPIAHFVNVMRSVLLKGSSFGDVIYNFRATMVLAVVFNTLAVLSYRKVN